ncbi:MAG: gamma-glutamylcyclotransferase family protein [Gammaproteobacteria bacterium]
MPTSYFAYGSNMASHRLLYRIPEAKEVATAMLPGHRLSFRKNDNGESGKCDIEMTGNQSDRVHGVVYQFPNREKVVLDWYEGLGVGYNDKLVEVATGTGEILSVLTYYALQIDESMLPYHWYKSHVLRGAIEHQLPADYISLIEATQSKRDPDYIRSEQELAIYA